MTASQPLPDRLRALWPPEEWVPCGVVVGVSGGADSVALLRGLHALAGSTPQAVSVAHLNHGLRGAEGEEDARFVQRLADELYLEAQIGELDVLAEKRGGEGIEAAARRARYRFLKQAAEVRGARFVAVAHTADDQAETVLHRLLRGAGLQGLSGMARARPLGPAVSLLRPLLDVRRHELREYLAAIGQSWREDHSNADPRFTRNRLRSRLLPLVEQEFGPHVIASICRASGLVREAQQAMLSEAERLATQAEAECNTHAICLRASTLAHAAPILVSEVLRACWRRQNWSEGAMSFTAWRKLAEMTCAPGDVAARMLPGGIRAEKKGEQLWLSRP